MAQELPGVGVKAPPPPGQGPEGPPGPATMTSGVIFPENPSAPWQHFDEGLGLWFYWNKDHEIWVAMTIVSAFGYGTNWINDTYMRNAFGEVMTATYGYISGFDRLLILGTWIAAATSSDGSFELQIDGVPQITIPFLSGETSGTEIVLDQEVNKGVVSIFQNGRARDPTVKFLASFFIRP